MNLLRISLKHWMASTPSPRHGRSALLRAAAGVRKYKPLDLAWFDAASLRHPTNQYYSVFSWAVANGFQSRSTICI